MWKNTFILIGIGLLFYGSIWLFNFVNAWIGILAFIVSILLVATGVKHNINKQNNKQNENN